MTIRSCTSMIAAALLVACLWGCTPSVNSVTVAPGSDVNLVTVKANISAAPAASMGTPVLRVASLADNPPVFHDVSGFAQTSTGNYEKDALALPPGQFRIEVQQPYTPLFTSGTQTVSKSTEATITIPPGCFSFDGSAQGWTTDGFFEIRTSSPTDFGTRSDLCSGQTPPQIGATGPNFPENYTSPIPTAFRSLATPLSPLINACFSHPVPAPQSGTVVVDLISPDLSTIPGWSSANGFQVQAKGQLLTGPSTPIRAQLLLVDSAGHFFRPEDAQHHATFVDLGGTFASASFALPNTTPAHVRVRLFVPTLTAADPQTLTEIDIDRVCPKTAP